MANLATINNNILADSGIDPLSLIVGTGTVNYVPKFTAEDTVANSQIFDNGTNVGIGTTSPTQKLTIAGDVQIGIPASVGALRFIGATDKFNFIIGKQINVNNAFEITPSTAVGGTTFSTPAFLVTSSGNVGIGTTSPSQALDVFGIVNIGRNQNSNVTNLNINSGSTPVSAFQISTDQPNLVAYLNSRNSYALGFYTNDAEQMRITSSGNVGIGTATPSVKLHVINTAGVAAYFTSSNNSVPVSLFNNGSALATIGFKGTTTSSEFNVRVGADANDFVAYTSNTERMRITSGGNVGIGTSAPGGRLDVVPSAQNGINVARAGGYPSLYGSNDFVFETDGVFYFGVYIPRVFSVNSSFYVTAAGNVGIGTGTPTSKLELYNSSGDTRMTVTSTGGTGASDLLLKNASGTVAYEWYVQALGADGRFRIFDNTGGSTGERLTIDQSGNVGIGTPSPLAKLDLTGGLDGTYNSNILINSNASTAKIAFNPSGGASTGIGSGNGTLLFYTNGANTERMRITSGGNVLVGTATSDGSQFRVYGGYITLGDGAYEGLIGKASTIISGGNVGDLGIRSAGGISISSGGNTERVRITSAGNVGIGTTNPITTLQVNATSPAIRLQETGSGGDKRLELSVNSSGVATIAANQSAQVLTFETVGSERMRITSSGVVGIGTSSPVGLFEVKGDGVSYFTRGTKSILLNPNVVGGDVNALIETSTGMALAFGTNGSERMRIATTGAVRFNAYGSGSFTGTRAYDLSVDASGNIIEVPVGAGTITGSGTTNYIPKWTSSSAIGNSDLITDGSGNLAIAQGNAPTQALNIYRAGSTQTVMAAGNSNTGLNGTYFGVDPNGNGIINTTGAFANIFSTNGSERMRITSGGNVLIGSTTNEAGSKLYVLNSITTDYSGTIGMRYNVSGQTNSYYKGMTGTALDNSTARGLHIFNYDADSNVGIQFWSNARPGSGTTPQVIITSSGNVGIGTTSPEAKLDVFGSSSDQIRLRTAASEYYRIGRNASTGYLDFWGSQSGYVGYTWSGVNGERMRLDASGNLGLGVVPSAFSSSYKSIQFGTTGSIFGESGDAANYYTTNTFIDAGGFKYITTDFALGYFQENGVHSWRTAASGSAGASISFTQAMTLDASGNLLVGATSTSQARGGASTRQLVKLGSGQSFLEIQAFNTSSDAGLLFANSNSSNYGLISYTPTDAMQFYANSAERMRLNTIGLGIGTSNPTSLLYLKGYVPTITFEGSGYVGDTWQIRTAASGSNSTFNFYNVTQGTYPLNIDGAGRVGIGTTTPAYKLDVINAGNTVARFLNSQTGANADLVIGNGNNSWTQRITGDGTYDYTLINNGTGARVLTALANGNVGIGTTSPGYKTEIRTDNQNATQTLLALTNSYGGATDGARLLFQVANTSGNGAAITGKRDGGTFGIDLLFETSSGVGSAATEKMRITSTGNVGIGTSSPSLISGYTGLNVLNSGYTQIKVQSTLTSAGIEFSPSSGFNYEIQASNSNQWFVYDRTSNAYRLVIHGTGNVSIGSNSDAGYKLDVNGIVRATGETILSGGTLYLNNTDNSQAAYLVSTGTGGSAPLIFATNSSERMRINPSGELLINTTTDYGDYKLQVNGNSYLGGNVQIGTSLNLGQSIIYTSTAFNYITGGSANWIKIGTLNMPQGGHNAYIRFYSGQGYNANNSQNGYVELFIRTSNGNSNDGGYYLSAFVQRFGYASFMTNFRLTANHPTSDNIDVYAYVQPYSGVGFYTVETSPSTSWTNSMTIVSEPTSYYTVTDNFKVLSYSTFENGIYTTSITFPGGGGSYNYITNSGLNLIINADDDIIFRNDNNIEKMRLTYYGYLGIGTSAPSNKLTVGGTNGLQLKLETSSGPNDYYAILSSNYNYAQSFLLRVKGGGNEQDIMQWGDGAGLYLNSRNSNPLVLQNAGGNVLINTTTDVGYKLNVVGNIASNAGTNEAQVFVTNSTSQIYLFNSYAGNSFGIYDGTAGQHRLLYDRASSFWAFYTGASERMRITSGGLVGIGATSAYIDGNDKLVVANGRIVSNALTYSAASFNRSNSGSIIDLLVGGYGKGYIGTDGTNVTLGSYSSLLFISNSSEQMRLTTGGNLLLGTTSDAGYKLDVTGTLRVNGNNNTAVALTVNGSDASEGLVAKFARGASEKNFYISATNNQYVNLATEGNFRFKTGISVNQPYTSGNDPMVLTSTGNVGIGTSSPTVKLQVSGTTLFEGGYANFLASGTIALRIGADGSNDIFMPSGRNLSISAEDNILFRTSGALTERFRITSSGNVGIGTSSPSGQLEVYEGFYKRLFVSYPNSTTTRLSIGHNFYIDNDQSPEITSFTNSSGTSIFRWLQGITPTERMRLSPSGNLLIGTTGDAGQKLQVSSSDNTRIAVIETSEGITSHWGANNGQVFFTAETNHPISFYTNGSTKMHIAAAGNVGIGTTSPISYSGYTTLALNNATNGAVLDFMSNGTRVASINNNASSFEIETKTAVPMVFSTNGSERMRITNGGIVGIGTSSPDASTMLQVQTSNSCSVRIVSSAASGGDLYLTSVNSGSESRIDKQGTAGPLTFYNNGSERMRITSSGNTELSGSIKTGTPSGGTAVPWKLGSRITNSCGLPGTYADFASSFMVSNKVIEVEIDGVLVYIPIVNPGWC